ncbi:hypothetical protein SAMN05216436_10957 [bacterium A37T11]|nr:hypothetical protein SAMN05216436_10957 [bacterium A37T11]
MMNDELLTHILISQGTHPFAQRLAKLLVSFECCYGITDPHSPLLQTTKYLLIPDAGSPHFVHGLLKSCLDRQIQLLIPLGQRELIPLAQAAPLFSEYGIDILLPSQQDLSFYPVLVDPARSCYPMVLHNGRDISGSSQKDSYELLSGIYIASDDGGELTLCCVTDL